MACYRKINKPLHVHEPIWTNFNDIYELLGLSELKVSTMVHFVVIVIIRGKYFTRRDLIYIKVLFYKQEAAVS